ncbi:ATP-binding protein [Streptomyces sp. ST2-7A]|uniref:ATP-binding protein n=1 Tax=Streptomyces sp. ST2-7A TaxID=2907214 RepID=UPI001F469D88|nr:ATP-binding protein [Streptomyces sp. ST2-7A]MCE7082093.1 ATP-binding protein [Streptomyces sp. ST2-7A]
MYRPSAAPLRPSIEVFRHAFPATPEAARHARHLVDNALRLLGMEDVEPFRSEVVAIVAELTANAATHGRASDQGFEVAAFLIPDGVRVEVGDRCEGDLSSVRPRALEDGDAESGRGLLIVTALAHRWGVAPSRTKAPGKTVWAELLRNGPPSAEEVP